MSSPSALFVLKKNIQVRYKKKKVGKDFLNADNHAAVEMFEN